MSLQGENPLEFERSEPRVVKKFPASVCLRFHHKVETLEKRPHAKFKKAKTSPHPSAGVCAHRAPDTLDAPTKPTRMADGDFFGSSCQLFVDGSDCFQNTSHRQIYSLNLEDLEKLQFYISRDVVAQYQDATGTKSLLLTRLTAGVATGAGPNWIKVSFREGGVDVPFVTDPNQYDGRYWIATEVEGSKDFKKIAELPEKSFLYKGVRYKLASGADAILLFDWEGWKKLVGTRKVTEGRQVGDR